MPSTKKSTKDFTASERAMIIARAEEVGKFKAADEFGTSWQAIAAWMKKEGKNNGEAPVVKAKKTKKSAGKKKIKKVTQKKVKAAQEVSAAPEVKKGAQEKKHKALPPEFENFILKEKVASLTEQIEKLKAAIAELA